MALVVMSPCGLGSRDTPLRSSAVDEVEGLEGVEKVVFSDLNYIP